MASPSSKDTEWGESQQQDSGPGPAFTEAQHWIEQVTGRSFGDKDFRTGLENGILLCELLNAIKPGAVKKINRLPTPIAGLDNITLFLRACEELGLKGSQLFDPGDLQDMTNRATIKVSDFGRKMKNVLITIYWLGKTANSCTSYSGPTLNLKEFEGLLSQIQKEMDDTDSPKRSIRDSGYIDSWDSERSDSLSPPRHTRDDSFDSLDSFGSRSQQTPSPEVIFRGSSDGRGSDSESDVTQKAPDMKRDDMSVRRTSYSEPKSSLPFNQYLPNKSNHTAYMPAPLRKKRAERGENYRKSWSNTTSPIATERPFSHSHPETIEEEQNEEFYKDEKLSQPSSTFTEVQGIDDTKAAVKCEPALTGDVGSPKKHLQVCVAEDSGHRVSREDAKWERKDEEEIKKLKRIQKAGITVMPASKRYCRQKRQDESCGQTTPDIILRRENAFLTSYQDNESDSEEEEQKVPDIEKDDLALRKAQVHQCKSKVAVNQFLPGPCTKKDRERWESIKQSANEAVRASQSKEQKMDSQSHIEVTESELIVPQKASVLLKSQQEIDSKVEERLKGPDIERDDLARRKALFGFTGRQKPHTFSPSSITSADMEMWQKLQLSTDTSEETSKPNKNVSEVKPISEIEVEKTTQDNPSCRRARRSSSGSCQRSVHFGPVTEIDQQYWEKLNIAGANPDSEAQEGADGNTIETYTCHLLPSVASTIILSSQDNVIRGESQATSGSDVNLDSQSELPSCKSEETCHSDTCMAEYFRRTPSPVLVAQTVTLSESSQDSSDEDDDGKTPDLEKDDMMSRRIKAASKQSSAVFNKFLPVPSSQRTQYKGGIHKGPEKTAKKMNKSKEESLATYSPTDALSDDAGSVSMNDMRPEEDVAVQPHSKARHEELHNIHSLLREDQDKWQEDLARWKNRRRSASQDLIKRKEERDIVEKIMSGERSSERRKSIKTYREIVEEKECRELALQEAYKNARTPEEAEAILKKYSQRFIISEPILENLVMPKFLERSRSVDSEAPSSPTKDPNSLKYLRQQSLPIQKYTATVEAMIIPSSQSQKNVSATVTSPTRTVACKAVPMLTPKPYSQPKDSQTVLKSFKKDGKIRINGDTSPTFTRVEEREPTSAISSSSFTSSQMFESVTSEDTPTLQSQIDYCHVTGAEQEISSSIKEPETEDTGQEERTEMPITTGTSQQSNTEEEFDLKSCCNKTATATIKDATQEEDQPWNLETSTLHIALSNNVGSGTKNTVDCKILMTDEACLTPEKDKPSESVQIQLQQETLKSETLQHGERGDVFDSTQRISEVEEETIEDSQPVDGINHQESPNTASVPVTVRNSWRRSEFFSQPEVKNSENVNIPVAPLNLPKRFDCWYWDPEEERKRQERWQKEQERLLQERYRKEQEKLRQEWEKAQREVEEEERRYHEEERKIIQETVPPLTPRSPALPISHPNEWICPSKTEGDSHSELIEDSSMHLENRNVQLQKDAQMVEAESWQAEDKGQMQAEEEQQKQLWEPAESQTLKKDETEQQDNWDETWKNKLETQHWQESTQPEPEEQKLNAQSEIHTLQMDEETIRERQNQADWQIPFADQEKLPAQAAGSPVFASRSWNAQELPSFLEIPRKQQQGDVVKTGSLDRSWALQSNTMERKNWSGSHENLQSGQSLPLPHSSLQLQAPSRSISGKKLCSTCGLPLGKGAAMIIETLSLYFHIQCFTCGICKGQLGDAATGTDVRIRNGLLNCNDCYIRSRTAGQPTTL
ncbi:LIM and calponin homology domains-containing protein 1-like isoform X2 [Stegostoma tigrinum]|uniref:LIM and calponin homology domains-containing protein 1-like isoform X2 n=1 Tax=Stegostoma tigrinum TaxID=3053191 RepID=UPI00202AE684|nr:LIM and calponin homology domains-containing protein 1-like isoform X2 [Stegostoma tigrinum]